MLTLIGAVDRLQATYLMIIPDDAVVWTYRLIVRPSPRQGLGVFAGVPIPSGEVVERVPCLPIPSEELELAGIPRSLMHRYAMPVMTPPGLAAMLFGFGALCSHEPDAQIANVRWEAVGPRVLHYLAIRDIAAGEKLVFEYGFDTGF